MKKLLALSAVLAFSGTAVAGSNFQPEVQITGNSALGSLNAVRHSQDNVQYIGCSLLEGNYGGSASCYARDLSGTTRSCSTTRSEMIRAVAAISADSTLAFAWNASGECTDITVHLSSEAVR